MRYFVTLAEELRFGRAAAREHPVQSALSQQIQRLERELDVRLLDRSIHHVDLTPAGAAFLIETQQILDHVGRSAHAARNAATSVPALCEGIIDAGYDTVPQILRELQDNHPDITKSKQAAPSSTGGWPTAARTSPSDVPPGPRPR
ncbi:LysR family transcriptional regulator [[Actinomadura] parvosata]|uniref:LysR family transcriptional regulator n=1 Tax=[Actinomadura] parvosata TaxID=1955412 RepID=UPI00406C08B6